jgi:hypothetical protein
MQKIMKVIGDPSKMYKNNPVCFDETMVGAAGVTISPDSFISDRSWIAPSDQSFVRYSVVGDNIFYLDGNLIMDKGSEFKGSLFSRGREDSDLRLYDSEINANVALDDRSYVSLSHSRVEGNLVVYGSGQLHCLRVNIFGNVIIDLPEKYAINLVDVEIHGDLILNSESFLYMAGCLLHGYNTIVKKGGGDLRMENCHYNNSGYNEYHITKDTKWTEKVTESKHI